MKTAKGELASLSNAQIGFSDLDPASRPKLRYRFLCQVSLSLACRPTQLHVWWPTGPGQFQLPVINFHYDPSAPEAALSYPNALNFDAGSCGVAHGLGFLEELELMERAGLSPAAIVHSATGASARRLAFKEKFGEIKPGYLSRFILTRHSPLETFANLRKHKIIVFDDQVFATGESPDVSGL